MSAHIATACGAVPVLAKPGRGVDEGLMIVGNEMARVSDLVAARDPRTARPAAGPTSDGRQVAGRT